MTAKTVLVVDDEPHIAHVVALKLRQAGYEVVTASDGDEALEMALETVPDAVVTDLQMPGMSGLELAARLAADPATRHVPVVMVTARGHLVEDAARARTNIRKILCKPFGPRVLVEEVAAVLALGEGGGAGRGAVAA